MSMLQILAEYVRAIKLAFATTWWLVFPIFLYYVFHRLYWVWLWRDYKGKLKWSMIEIKPPRNIERSPRVMEQIFTALHGAFSTLNWFDFYLKGKKFQPMFVFEIRGIDGEMRFYVRMERKFRNMVESLVYAQYPEAEIEDVEDYAMEVPSNLPNSEWDLWGCDFELIRDDAYPIRTYHKFQEDVTKGMIDPLGSFADLVAGLPPRVEAWCQLLIIPMKNSEWEPYVRKVVAKLTKREEKKKAGLIASFFKETVDILSSSVQYIFGPISEKKEEKKEEEFIQFRLTPIERDVLQAVEESLSKKAFKTKIRFLVLGPRDVFSEDLRKGPLGFFDQFGDANLNTLKTNNDTKTYANYFFVEMRKQWTKRKIFLRYITRDNDGPNIILNSEELATIYHMPDMSAMSPAIARVEAKKGGPPSNLPVE